MSISISSSLARNKLNTQIWVNKSMATNSVFRTIFVFLILFSIFSGRVLSQSNSRSTQAVVEECQPESGNCNSKSKALPLKIIAIVSILVTSMVGVCLPLLSRSVPALQPDRNLFVIVKAFAAGIILATGFMHVLPDSFDMLRSPCLRENPWHKFPFSGFLAMLSAVVALMVDSISTSIYSHRSNVDVKPTEIEAAADGDSRDREMGVVISSGIHFHGHCHAPMDTTTSGDSQLLRYRVIAMVLELGIIVHSVVIGLSLGASDNTCTIKPLVAALCFHQMFEGMGLGGCILQAEYKFLKKALMAFFFSVTTPFGIVLGMALSRTYEENSSSSLITIGLLNASSAGLLIYMALVDLLSADFMGPRLQRSIKLQIKSYIAVLLGCGGMSLMAKWA